MEKTYTMFNVISICNFNLQISKFKPTIPPPKDC